jgi:hypothetical protein
MTDEIVTKTGLLIIADDKILDSRKYAKKIEARLPNTDKPSITQFIFLYSSAKLSPFIVSSNSLNSFKSI